MAEPRSSITPHIDGVGRIMVTSHGVHPADFWAQVTAEQLVNPGPNVTGKRLADARVLQAKIAAILEPHHQGVQDRSREQIKSGTALQSVVPENHRDAALVAADDVIKAATGTEWEPIFNEPGVRESIAFEIARHFATSQDIEHRTHADKAGVQ